MQIQSTVKQTMDTHQQALHHHFKSPWRPLLQY